MTDIYGSISTRATPQTQKADERQVPNSAGGYTFALDDEARLRRFLVLGSEGGTYYASAKDLTLDNAAVLMRMAKTQAARMVEVIREVSVAGRAPKANPALFALAVVASHADTDGRQAAFAAVPDVVRTGTHLFIFTRYLKQFRGMGRGIKRALASWYLDTPVEDLAYQMVKYRQREGWSHRDVLRQAHPKTVEEDRKALFHWAVGRGTDDEHLPDLVQAFLALQDPDMGVGPAVDIIETQRGVSWEMLPDRFLGEKDVWVALLAKGMPQTALMRQLPRLTNLGLLKGETGKAVAAQLADPERLRKGRVHPLNVLVAQRTYASGRGARGSLEWAPERLIVDALDAAFYASFGTVESTGKRTMLALDISGSMTVPISNMPISAREASAAMAMVTAAVEDDYEIVGFAANSGWGSWRGHDKVTEVYPGLVNLSISPRQRLDDVLAATDRLPFAGTDCSLPMLHAAENGLEIDTFIVYTDNETYAGRMHPHQALAQYRQKTGIDARLIVVGMTSTGFSIADPSDPGMLDVVGFDTATPDLVSQFARGL